MLKLGDEKLVCDEGVIDESDWTSDKITNQSQIVQRTDYF